MYISVMCIYVSGKVYKHLYILREKERICVRERECVYVTVRESVRERERVRECVCVCLLK